MFMLLLAMQASTSCQWTPGGWQCLDLSVPSTSSTAPVDYGKIVNSGRQLVPDYNEQQSAEAQIANLRARTQALQQANEQAQVSSAVGSLVSDGRCSDAIDLALRHGRLDLANQVKQFCGK